MLNVTDFAKMINDDCQEMRYFWAYGFVKESLVIWEKPSNLKFLCDTGKLMVETALEEKKDLIKYNKFSKPGSYRIIKKGREG